MKTFIEQPRVRPHSLQGATGTYAFGGLPMLGTTAFGGNVPLSVAMPVLFLGLGVTATGIYIGYKKGGAVGALVGFLAAGVVNWTVNIIVSSAFGRQT